MSISQALLGGALNFFSIWILCLLQVVPFLFATITANSLLEMGNSDWKDQLGGTLTLLFSCLLGFGIVYYILGTSTTGLAALLFKYQPIFLQIGGVFLFLCGFYFLGFLKIPETFTKPLRLTGNFLVGAILGLAYQPCITPTLAKIYNMVKDPNAFSEGVWFMLIYTTGLVSALAISFFGLVFILSVSKGKMLRPIIIKFCGLAMMMISGLILFQKMTVYKGFLVKM